MPLFSRRDQALDWIVNKLRYEPATSVDDIAEDLDVQKETVRTYFTDLVDKEIAFRTEISLTRNQRAGYQRFWIFIETAYQPWLCAKVDAGHHQDRQDPANYQQTLAEVIANEIRKRDKLVYVSVDIILGSDYDLIVVVDAEEHKAILDFVTGFVRIQPHVLRSATGWTESADKTPIGAKVSSYRQEAADNDAGSQSG